MWSSPWMASLANAVAFTVVPMPVITGISPTSGPGGTVFTISGNNLLDLNGNQTVTFNGQSTPIASASETALKVILPAPTAAGQYHFHVLTNDTGINTPTFTVSVPRGTITGPALDQLWKGQRLPAGQDPTGSLQPDAGADLYGGRHHYPRPPPGAHYGTAGCRLHDRRRQHLLGQRGARAIPAR